jgi:uncharacterized protein (UPF0261 family)
MSIGGLQGGSSYDPEGDQIFFKTIRKGVNENIPVYELDCHVNEEPLGRKVVEEFFEMMK